MKTIRQLKRELLCAIVAVFVATFALTSSTYAWYVANNSVMATTATVSAKTNGFVLQIANAEDGTVHGTGGTLTHTFTTGGILSPASSDDMKHWYVPQGWNEQGKITSYMTPNFDSGSDAKPGQYTVSGTKYFAYIRSDYVVYTVSETGFANVYLEDGGAEYPPIEITTHGGTGVSTFKDSLRVAITTQGYDQTTRKGTGTEDLRFVYAVKNETGIGNDSTGKSGWTSIQLDGETVKLDNVTYKYLYQGHYSDQNGKNWAASKTGDNFTVPDGSIPIASNVDYNGILVHVYLWLEGTDADCVNGKSIENDTTTYDVTINLAGVATGS